MHPVPDKQTVLDRLLLPMEEATHPWSASRSLPFHMPLLRVWDMDSGSLPEEVGRMMARAPEMRLADKHSRRDSLSIHIDYSIWIETPYISFTTSDTRIEWLVKTRTDKNSRGAQMLTVIDPDNRLRNGLPIIGVKAEMQHYGIQDPYNKHGEYYVHEYLCLWQVTTAEIIGHWKWSDLAEDKNWYRNIILRVYDKFVEVAATNSTGDTIVESKTGQPAKDSLGGLPSDFAKLSGKSIHLR
ncbi:hypothetical protein NUW58_g154 [Xylaria curta]|uniref:Uncharacterized protein n=1 Tax=Xylaria curta TaxID=42375 RepID=A0ACC1PS22_9PEZI|nr:hypothetical protein NUW58_g154 [Xylaria curta]